MTTEILQVRSVNDDSVSFTDFSAVAIEYAPSAEPGDWYLFETDDETGDVLKVEKR